MSCRRKLTPRRCCLDLTGLSNTGERNYEGRYPTGISSVLCISFRIIQVIFWFFISLFLLSHFPIGSEIRLEREVFLTLPPWASEAHPNNFLEVVLWFHFRIAFLDPYKDGFEEQPLALLEWLMIIYICFYAQRAR